MGAMTDLKIKDDAATPVEYTLVPITDTPNPVWRSGIAGVPVEGQVRLTYVEELLKSGSYRLSGKLEVPVMEQLGTAGTQAGYVAAPKVAFVNTAIFTMFADKRSTSQDRANLIKLLAGCLCGASATTATGTLNQASVGGAFVASTAPITNAFVNIVKPN